MTPVPDAMLAALGALDSVPQARWGRMLSTLGEDCVPPLVAEAQQIQAAPGGRQDTSPVLYSGRVPSYRPASA